MSLFLSQQPREKFFGKKVLVRIDVNVPVNNGAILPTDQNRIRASLPTLEWLRSAGAKIIILAHIGRVGDSLEPVAHVINNLFTIGFSGELLGAITYDMIDGMGNGSAIMLENIRTDEREELCDESFITELAQLADYYVNDAFAVSHRKHASIVGIPKYLESFLGLQCEQEIKNLEKVFHPEHPAGLIIGGAKFETKLPLIEKFLPIMDTIFVCGALANNFLQAQGYPIGKSLVESGVILDHLIPLIGTKIYIPHDVIVERNNELVACFVTDVQPDDVIVDIGPETIMHHQEIIKNLHTVIWNGNIGKDGANSGSQSLANTIAQSRNFSLVGGGDTVALLEKLEMAQHFSFVSTGGGAMLDYLVHHNLPGIDAVRQSMRQ